MEQIIHWIILFAGVFSAVYLIRVNRPDWMGFPLAILVIEATRDMGIGPIIINILNLASEESWIGRATFSEKISAIGLMMLYYMCVASGMIIAALRHPRNVTRNHTIHISSYSPDEMERGWQVGRIVFWIGFFTNIAVLAYLLSERSLLELASERAVYTDEKALSMRSYHYLRTLSSIMQYGALSMLFFTSGNPLRIKKAIIGNLLFVAFQSLYGGRHRVIIGVLTMMLAYHYGCRKIVFKTISQYLIIGFVFLTFISYARFQTSLLSDTLILPLTSISVSWRIDETAFILRVFPKQIPFTGNINMVAALLRFLPTVNISETSNLWLHLVDMFHGGKNPQSGIGGENFATAAELYSWGGCLSVIVFALLAGWFFGMIFEWHRRDKNNIFKTLFVILAWSGIFNIESRLPNAIGSTVYPFVCVALMAALTIRSFHGRLLLLLLYFDLTAFLAYQSFRDSGMSFLYLNFGMLKYVIIATLPIIYLLCIRVIQNSGRGLQLRNSLKYDDAADSLQIGISE